jgi:hypothetical protein
VPAAIEVLEIRPVSDRGSLRAFVKLRLGALVIHGVGVVQQQGQKPWVALPQQPARQKADDSGSGWFPVVEATPELMAKIRAVVLHAWTERTYSDAPDRPIRGGRQSHEPLDEIADAWSKRQRDEHIKELAKRFDERGPDAVPF